MPAGSPIAPMARTSCPPHHPFQEAPRQACRPHATGRPSLGVNMPSRRESAASRQWRRQPARAFAGGLCGAFERQPLSPSKRCRFRTRRAWWRPPPNCLSPGDHRSAPRHLKNQISSSVSWPCAVLHDPVGFPFMILESLHPRMAVNAPARSIRCAPVLGMTKPCFIGC